MESRVAILDFREAFFDTRKYRTVGSDAQIHHAKRYPSFVVFWSVESSFERRRQQLEQTHAFFWLAAAGFPVGARVVVRVEPGRIVLEPEGSPDA